MIKRHLISLICLLTMLSVVGLLSGCGASTATVSTPAPTATPFATATPAVTAYTSSDGQYSLKYPTGWMVKVTAAARTSGIVQFGDSAGNDQLSVEPLTVQAVPNYPTLLESALSNPANFQNTKVETTTHTTSYPSGAWTVTNATTIFFGEPYVVHLYATVHRGHTVLILTYAPSSSATSDQATYLDPMLISFTFLK